MRLLSFAAALVAALIAGRATVLAGPPSPPELVKAELLAEPLAVRPGEPFWVGIRLRMKERWHIYWRNPGDSGLPTEAKWTLPPGFSAGPIAWPVPQGIPVSHLVNYGYEGETTLLVPLTPPSDLDTARPVAIKAEVSWLVCETECVPGAASLALELAVAERGSSAAPNPATRDAFAAARARLPQPSPWPARAEVSADVVRLAVGADGAKPDAVRAATFFPYSETLIDHAAPQRLEGEAEGFSLTLKRSAAAPAAPDRIEGVLVVEEATPSGRARRAYEIAAPVSVVPGGSETRAGRSPIAAPPADLAEIVGAALLAFAGGLVLNLMPCVFPVLSIKALSLLRPAESAGHLRLHGLAYTIGVLVSFLSLAAILIAVRAGGAEVGWGFQLQSPAVVAGLVFVLFAMGLSLSGAYHLGPSLAGLGDGLARRAGLSGSFFTGILATVVATPCTAPFMGAATGFALTQPPPVALAVFFAMGLGLAAPFLALTLVPAWRRRLPRPGPWMETLKQALAFPLYATAAWLLWVLSQEVGPTGLLVAMLGLVLVGFGIWCLDLARGSAGARARIAQAFALASIALIGLVLAAVSEDRRSGASPTAVAEAGAEPFSQARLDSLLAEGRPVFVNMTAAWCLTCIVNERGALASQKVRAAFADKNVAYLKGDWTNQNPEITRVLERHGRGGVPLYLLYPGRGEPVVLPQILTESTLLASLAAVAPARSPGPRADTAPGLEQPVRRSALP